MAFYATGTFTTANQTLIDLSQMLADNGWIIDFDGVYNTSYRRLHVHKGNAHFDFFSLNATQIYCYGCTGYSSGAAPSAQPGVSTYKTFYGVAGQPYHMIVTPYAAYLGFFQSATSIYWGGFFLVQSKIGNWADGFFVQGVSSNNFIASNTYGTSYGSGQIYYNGGWSPNAVAGGIIGSNAMADLVTKQPFFFSGGIMPVPVVLFIGNATDSAKKHPIGYAPGLYRIGVSDIYVSGDIITIGADSYIVLPSSALPIGTATSEFLFKLGA